MTELASVAGAAFAIYALASLCQAVTGFGSALVAVPLLAITLDPTTAVVTAALVGTALAGGAWCRERSHGDGASIRRLTTAAVLGMPFGLVALSVADDRTLTLLMAVALVVALVALTVGKELPAGPGSQWGAGFISGGLLTSTGMNGPPLVLSLRAMEPRRYRATLQAAFFWQDLAGVAAFALAGLASSATLVPAVSGTLAVPLGWSLGDRMFRRLSVRVFRALVLCGLGLIAVVMVASVAVGAE